MNKLTRLNLVLLALLVVQAPLVWWLSRDNEASGKPRPEDAGVAGREPYSAIKASEARAITVTSGEGKVISLAGTPKKEGDKDVVSWVLANRDGFPARTPDVEKIVESAKKIRLSRVITRKEIRYGKLNVADGVMHARVRIAGEGGKVLADFRLGEGSFGNFNLRMEGDPAVYEAAGVSTWEFPTSVSSLVDASFLDVPSDQVTRVRITAGAEMLDVMKEVPESRPASQPASRPETDSSPATRAETKPAEPRWVLASNHEVLDKTKVDGWVRGLSRISLSDPIGKEKKPEYGFDKPASTVVLTTADGKETTITIGAERKDEHDFYMTATGKEFVVTAASWSVTESFQKKLKDLQPGTTGGEDHAGHDHR